MKDTSQIPAETYYCYSVVGVEGNGRLKLVKCSFWSKRVDKPEQENGYCSFLEKGDWESEGSLLWDQVKDVDCPVP